MRREALQFAQWLIQSLHNDEGWTFRAGVIENGKGLTIHVYATDVRVEGVSVWIPLLKRCCVRRAVRQLVIRRASKLL